jgi:hypothetical protein
MNIFPIGGLQTHDKIILGEIKPFIEYLMENQLIENFHFLPENHEIRFRLYGDLEKFQGQTEDWLKKLIQEGQIEEKSGFNQSYDGEEKEAGKLGQEAYYAYMKAGTEIARRCKAKADKILPSLTEKYNSIGYIRKKIKNGLMDETDRLSELVVKLFSEQSPKGILDYLK